MTRKSLIMTVSSLTLGAVVLATALPALAMGPGKGGAAFGMLDADNSGTVTLEEFQAPVQERFSAADADGDGTLSEDELANFKPQFGKRGGGHGHGHGHDEGQGQRFGGSDEKRAERAARMVAMLDSNDDGLLSAEEITEGPSATRIFAKLDADGSGDLSLEEFEAAKKHLKQFRKGQPPVE